VGAEGSASSVASNSAVDPIFDEKDDDGWDDWGEEEEEQEIENEEELNNFSADNLQENLFNRPKSLQTAKAGTTDPLSSLDIKVRRFSTLHPFKDLITPLSQHFQKHTCNLNLKLKFHLKL